LVRSCRFCSAARATRLPFTSCGPAPCHNKQLSRYGIFERRICKKNFYSSFTVKRNITLCHSLSGLIRPRPDSYTFASLCEGRGSAECDRLSSLGFLHRIARHRPTGPRSLIDNVTVSDCMIGSDLSPLPLRAVQARCRLPGRIGAEIVRRGRVSAASWSRTPPLRQPSTELTYVNLTYRKLGTFSQVRALRRNIIHVMFSSGRVPPGQPSSLKTGLTHGLAR
jgi:hypothetical protein